VVIIDELADIMLTAQQEVEKTIARLIERRRIEEGLDQGEGVALALELDFGDVSARIAISDLFEERNRLLTASFEAGELVYDDTTAEKVRLKTSPRDPGGTFRLGPGTPLERAVMDFAQAIRRGVPDFGDAELGSEVVKVLEKLQETIP